MIGYKCRRAIRNAPWCIWRHVSARAIKIYSRHTSNKINSSSSTEPDLWNSSAWLMVLSEQKLVTHLNIHVSMTLCHFCS
jgi:hypothetical protein